MKENGSNEGRGEGEEGGGADEESNDQNVTTMFVYDNEFLPVFQVKKR